MLRTFVSKNPPMSQFRPPMDLPRVIFIRVRTELGMVLHFHNFHNKARTILNVPREVTSAELTEDDLHRR